MGFVVDKVASGGFVPNVSGTTTHSTICMISVNRYIIESVVKQPT
jgi:hypothetical protein